MRARSAAIRLGVVVIATTAALPAAVASAAPAPPAAKDQVLIIGMPAQFQAGGAGGVMTVSVTRRKQGCVRLDGLTLVTLKKLKQDGLRVELGVGLGWESSTLSPANPDTYRAEDISVDPQELCTNKTRAIRHRITFLAGAPAGSAKFEAVVIAHGSSELGRASTSRPVVAAAPATAPATTAPPTAGPSGSARPSATATSAAPSASAGASASDPAGVLAAPVVGNPADPGAGRGTVARANSVRDLVIGSLIAVAVLAALGFGGLLAYTLWSRRRDDNDSAGGGGDPFPPTHPLGPLTSGPLADHPTAPLMPGPLSHGPLSPGPLSHGPPTDHPTAPLPTVP